MYYTIPDSSKKYKVLQDVTVNIVLRHAYSCYNLYRKITGVNITYHDYLVYISTSKSIDLFIIKDSIFYLYSLGDRLIYIRFYSKDKNKRELCTNGKIILTREEFAKIDCEPI